MTGKQRQRQKLQRRKARMDNQMFACMACDKWLDRHWHLALGMSESLKQPICTRCANIVNNTRQRLASAGQVCSLCQNTGILGEHVKSLLEGEHDTRKTTWQVTRGL